MTEQIDRDLAGCAGGVSAESFAFARRCIDDRSLPRVHLISIRPGGVRAYPQKLSKRAGSIVRYLRRLHQRKPLAGADFLLGAADIWRFPESATRGWVDRLPPVFVFSASIQEPWRSRHVLVPDDHTLGDHLIGYRQGWSRLYAKMLCRRDRYPYATRKPKAFWRGLATDRVREYPDGRTPRVKLVEYSQARPDILDAAMTTTPILNKMVRKNLRPVMQMFSIPPYASYETQLRYQVLPCLDGRANTYPGLLWRLASGSVVIKQETPYQQWFYNLLEPWKHYIPAAKQMDDIIERIEWALANPAEAERIARQGMAIVDASLTPRAIECYVRLLLGRYASLCRNDRHQAPL